MSYWLIKSEPDAWSWDEQVKAGAKGTAWTGVRNHTAKLNLMKMKKGERALRAQISGFRAGDRLSRDQLHEHDA